MARAASDVDATLAALVPGRDGALARLHDAMRYVLLGGGKRLRPFLVMESARLFNVAPDHAVRTAAAVEMIHCYSLVHDDLPAMDDDDMRRGRPTTHIAYDEATAILVGDALLTRAFEVLAESETHPDPTVRCTLVSGLASAAGMAGMVGGQVIDLAAENQTLSLDQITELQALKTGALIAFSAQAGAVLGGASDTAMAALLSYARRLGLAFQIADDLLDVEGEATAVGKGVGKDAAAGKATFVSLLGVGQARSKARRLVDEAIGDLAVFGDAADGLRAVADFVVTRNH